MTKRQLIDEIVTLNHTAEAGFLARFQDEDLRQYLEHLQALRGPRLTGNASRYAKYFAAGAAPAGPEPCPPAVTTEVDVAERAALLSEAPPAAAAVEGPAETPAQEPAAALEGAAVEPAQEPLVADQTGNLQDDADDDPDYEPDDEGPTSRRQSVTARAAKAWRAEIQDSEDAPDPERETLDPADEAPPDDDEEPPSDGYEPDAIEDDATGPPDDPAGTSAAEDLLPEDLQAEEEPSSQPVASARKSAADQEEDFQSWLF